MRCEKFMYKVYCNYGYSMQLSQKVSDFVINDNVMYYDELHVQFYLPKIEVFVIFKNQGLKRESIQTCKIPNQDTLEEAVQFLSWYVEVHQLLSCSHPLCPSKTQHQCPSSSSF